MANAAIANINLADAGTVSASSQISSLPASNLLQSDVETRWRSNTNSDFFVSDLLSRVSLDSIFVPGLTGGSNTTVRARVSSVDSSGLAGDLYDSNSDATANFDANYDAFAAMLSAPVSGRYVRIDISDPDAAFVEAGRIIVCLRTSFTYNYGYGWQIQWEDRSTSAESRGGQDLTWIDSKRRHVTVEFKWVTTTQRYSVVEVIDRDNGVHKDVLLILDTASANLARDCIFGLIESQTPIVQPDPVFASDGPLYSKQYVVKERR